jgi:hypothetical protein
VRSQLARIPADATHLVLSVGGNDGLGYSGILGQPARSVAEVLGALGEIGREFEERYRAMLEAVLARGLPTAICTIYNPSYPDALRQRVSVAALTFLNDPIVRIAAERGLPLIDLGSSAPTRPITRTRSSRPHAAARRSRPRSRVSSSITISAAAARSSCAEARQISPRLRSLPASRKRAD